MKDVDARFPPTAGDGVALEVHICIHRGEMQLRPLLVEGLTSVRAALRIRIVTAGQLAELSRLTFCTFQLISMELHSPARGSERTFVVGFSQFLLVVVPPDSRESRFREA